MDCQLCHQPIDGYLCGPRSEAYMNCCDARYHRICLQAFLSKDISVDNSQRTIESGHHYSKIAYQYNGAPCESCQTVVGRKNAFDWYNSAAGRWRRWQGRVTVMLVLAGGIGGQFLAFRIGSKIKFMSEAATHLSLLVIGPLAPALLVSKGPTGRAKENFVTFLYNKYHGTEFTEQRTIEVA